MLLSFPGDDWAGDLGSAEVMILRRVVGAFRQEICLLRARAAQLVMITAEQGDAAAQRWLDWHYSLPTRHAAAIKLTTAAERRRALDILTDALAERFPAFALSLCAAESVTVDQAIDELRAVALDGGLPPAPGPGGERRQ